MPIHRRVHAAFTLTELLVVIGIITILISILLPVVSRVRYAAYTADTQNEISQLSNACTAYYSTYHAYPGPFSNDDTTGGVANHSPIGFGTGSGTPTLTGIYFPSGSPPVGTYLTVSSDAAATSPWTVTGAENLVLGLMGGLRPIPATAPQQVAFAPAEVGLGPLSLNPNNPTRAPSFFSTGSNYLMWCQQNAAGQNVRITGVYQNLSGTATTFSGTPFTDVAGIPASDCPIPVFVDRYPTNPMPILYLRARTGAKGIVWDNITVQTDVNGAPAYYQYDLREILPYTSPNSAGGAIGLPKGSQQNLQIFNTSIFLNPNYPTHGSYYLGIKDNLPNNAGPYFWNSSVTPTNASTDANINFTGRPRAVDQFILISAGRDGVYGTADDITSFGDVSQ
jgi:prepilin-type N-terminal cleavage/methylation domain-containing protein